MLKYKQPRSEQHLINILRTTKAHHPNFALLLGAGSSITSGIEPAGKLVKIWRKKYHELHCEDGKSEEDFIKQHHWYNTAEEYATLFELLYDQPAQRREFIESCVESAFPSWGYIYLVNLIRNKVFNIVLTTNFDDLLNEACYQFSSDVRPMLCAHDSSIRFLRVTSKRPKIIKLHGDFLFDDIKNTVTELESLEGNIREKLKHIACEYGLIVVGYAGNDRSIMDSIDILLKSESSFPHGIYWCIKDDAEDNLSNKLEALRRDSRVHIIKIHGFDEFFANLHNGLGLELQEELSNPYQQLAEKLNTLLTKTRLVEKETNNPKAYIHPVIEKDIISLGTKLSGMSQIQSGKVNNVLDPKEADSIKLSTGCGVVEIPIPYSLLAQISEREGQIDDALIYMKQQIRKSPRAEDFVYAIGLYRRHKSNSEIEELVANIKRNINVFSQNTYMITRIALELIHMEEYDHAQDVLKVQSEMDKHAETDDDYLRMNMIQILRHQNKEVVENDINFLRAKKRSNDLVTKLGALILLQENEEAIGVLKCVLKNGTLTRNEFYSWPIFKLLPVSVDEENNVIEMISSSNPNMEKQKTLVSNSTQETN